MIKMIQGAKIKDADKLNEEFEVKSTTITSNVNSDKILNILNDFIEVQENPLFLIIEVPTNAKDEEVKDNIVETFHKDIYYADGLSKETVKGFFSEFGSLFINDGITQVGIGNHITKAEIMTDKYNIVHIYMGNDDSNRYEEILIKNNLKKVKKLITAWDYFTKSNPGNSMSIKEDGKTVYDVIEILKDSIGLYFAERREDK